MAKKKKKKASKKRKTVRKAKKLKSVKKRKKKKTNLKKQNTKNNNKIFKVQPDWAKKAYIDKIGYEKKYSQSINDNDAFWAEEGKRIDWIKPYSKIKDVTYNPGDFLIVDNESSLSFEIISETKIFEIISLIKLPYKSYAEMHNLN